MNSVANNTFLAFAKANNIEQFKTLLELYKELDININFQNNEGNTALMIAVENGNIEIVKLLLNYKDDNNSYIADPNIQNDNGETALILAICRCYVDIAEILIYGEKEGRRSVNIDLETIDGLTALDIALDNNDDIATMLKISKLGQNKIPNSDKYDVLNVLLGVKKHYNAKNLILTMNIDGTTITYKLE